MPQQLRIEETKNEGPKMLKKYLEYAFNISNGKGEEYLSDQSEHSADWYLSSRIAKMDFEKIGGISMDNSMPFVDLTIKHKGKYLAALLTDDNLYHNAISIKASHVYKHYVLKQKNWNFLSLYSRQLWSHPEHVKEQVDRLIGRNIEA